MTSNAARHVGRHEFIRFAVEHGWGPSLSLLRRNLALNRGTWWERAHDFAVRIDAYKGINPPDDVTMFLVEAIRSERQKRGMG